SVADSKLPRSLLGPRTTKSSALPQGSTHNVQAIKYRHDRLRLHGPGSLECVSSGEPVLQARVSPCAQGLLCQKRRSDQGLRRELGLRVVRNRLAKANRAEGHRRDRRRLAEQYA